MSPPGRPKGSYRSAQHEGTPMSPQAALGANSLSEGPHEVCRVQQ